MTDLSDVMAGWPDDPTAEAARLRESLEQANAICGDLRAEVERLRGELKQAIEERDYARGLRLQNLQERDEARAEVERLRVIQAAFAKVPQEQQARIMAAVRAEMADSPPSGITALTAEER